MSEQLEQLYQDAKSALKAKDYTRASELLRQILLIDENFKDTSRLLAQTIKLKRRRWYNDPRLWEPVIGIVVIGLLVWLVPKISLPVRPVPAATARTTVRPTATFTPTRRAIPTMTPSPTLTPIPLAWKRINIGQEFPRDTITDIVVDPKDPDVIYVGTENAGVYKSIDKGVSWQPIQYGLGGGRIGGLAIDPNDAQVLYAAIAQGGIYKTVDGGQSWAQLWAGDFSSEHEVAVAPWDSRVLFQWGRWGSHRSDDGGVTFHPIADNCLSQGILVISPSQPGTLYLDSLVDPYDPQAACQGGIYRSRDRGVTWELIGLEGYYWVGGREVAFAVGGIDDQSIYVVASTKPHPQEGAVALYATSDGGLTWSAVSKRFCSSIHVNPLDGKEVHCFFVHDAFPKVSLDGGKTWRTLKPAESSTFQGFSLFRAGDMVLLGGDGLFVSYDNGINWQERSAGLGARRLELKINPNGIMPLYLQEGNCDVVKARILYRSLDEGLHWKTVTKEGCDLAFDADGNTLYRGSIIFKSSGVDWIWVGPTGHIDTFLQSSLAHPTQPGKLFTIGAVGDRSHFYRSLNFGETWEEVKNSPDIGGAYPRLFYDAEGEVMYLTASYRMFHSEDEGSTWAPCTQTNIYTSLSDQVLAIDPLDNRHLYAATPGTGILVSTDGCRSWEESNTGLDSLNINAIVIDPSHPDTLYAGTDGGAYVSIDGGQTWGQVNDGLLGATVVYSIVVDKDSNVYAATPYGIFKLENK